MTPTPLPPVVLAKIEEIALAGSSRYEDSTRRNSAREMAEHLLEPVCPRCGANDHPQHPLHSGVLCGRPQSLVTPVTRAQFLSRRKP